MKPGYKNILVPVDFREPSVHAINFAVNLAQRREGEVVLLHVLETPGILADFFSSGDHLVKITDQSKEKMLALASSIRESHPDVQISSRVERGKPYMKILEVAQEIRARMIILGENHQGDDLEQDLGSTVYHVTLKSPVPVLTLKGNYENPGDKIVVPLDLTKETRRQLFSALVYGLNYGAEIHLVSCVVGGIKIKESRIYRKLKASRQTLVDNGVSCHIELFERSEVPPWMRVLEYADKTGAGMILLMTHQEGYTHDNYIGAFAHHIINLSKVPVLSLTSTATEVNFSEVIKGMVDPVGLFSPR